MLARRLDPVAPYAWPLGEALLEVIASRQPKIDMSLSIECVCGFHNRFLLALPELFRP